MMYGLIGIVIVAVAAVAAVCGWWRRHTLRLRLERRGREGESAVCDVLSRLKRKDSIVLNDIMIPTGRGGSSQIDHLVISTRGIFVIETKSHVGYIRGYEHAEYWHQYVGDTERAFYNPLLQNETHLKAVRKLLSEEFDLPYISMIVFTGASGVDIASDDIVRHRRFLPARRYKRTLQPEKELRRTFLSFLWWKKPVTLDQSKIVVSINDLQYEIERRRRLIERDELREVASTIEGSLLGASDARRDHVGYVREIAKSTERSIRYGICPRCGGRLRYVNHNGHRSYICGSFPECRFSCDE